jgi:twitching motility protein PilT
MRRFNFLEMLLWARSRGASDLHCSSGVPPVIRLDGTLEIVSGYSEVESDELIQQVREFLSGSQQAIVHKSHQLDCAIDVSGVGRVRLNIFLHARGWGVAARLLAQTIPGLSVLGLPPVVGSLAQLTQGLVVITGPTGSGKSTTLAALVDECNLRQGAHIITIEDPIEYIHICKRSVVHQREVGTHVESFADALRGALREDPDIILVGELRDLETTRLALMAAETGHLVLTSLHAASAPGTLDRIIDMFPAEQQRQVRAVLADTLQAVVAQTLICKRVGGRVPVSEVLLATPAVRALIRDAKSHQLQGLMQTSTALGMQTRERSLQELIELGVVDSEKV